MSREHEQSGNKLISGIYTDNIDSFLTTITSSCTRTFPQIRSFLYDNGTYKRPNNGILQTTDGVSLSLYDTPTYPTAVIYNNKSNGKIICSELPEGPIVVFSDTKNSINWEPKTLIERINTGIENTYSKLHKDESFWFKLGQVKLVHGKFYLGGGEGAECKGGTSRKHQTKNITKRKYKIRKTIRKRKSKKTT